MLSLLLASQFLFAPPPAPPPAPEMGYESALVELERASKEANRSASPVTIDRLERAIDGVERYPVELSGDAAGHEQRALAQLNLARLHLNKGDEAAAARVMDDAIFAAGIAPLPADRFGPDIEALHGARVAALRAGGRGPLSVDCGMPCSVYVDGNAIAGTEVELFLGPHQVHVSAEGVEPLTQDIELGADGVRVEFGGGAKGVELAEPVTPSDEGQGTKLAWGEVERPVPKWKIAGLATSGVLFVGSTAATIGMTVANGPNGSVRRDLLAAAEASLEDDKESNDVDPSGSDLCAVAQAAPDPSNPDQVANGAVTEICVRSDNLANAALGMAVVAGVSGVSTLVFGLLLNTHRVPKGAAAALRRHQPSVAVVPGRGRGLSVAAGFRF